MVYDDIVIIIAQVVQSRTALFFRVFYRATARTRPRCSNRNDNVLTRLRHTHARTCANNLINVRTDAKSSTHNTRPHRPLHLRLTAEVAHRRVSVFTLYTCTYYLSLLLYNALPNIIYHWSSLASVFVPRERANRLSTSHCLRSSYIIHVSVVGRGTIAHYCTSDPRIRFAVALNYPISIFIEIEIVCNFFENVDVCMMMRFKS